MNDEEIDNAYREGVDKLINKKNFNTARLCFDNVLLHAPLHKNALYHKAICYKFQNEHALVVATTKDYLTLHDSRYEIQILQALGFEGLEQWGESIQSAKEALKLNPESSEADEVLARVHYLTAGFQTAIRHATSALSRKKTARVYTLRSKCYEGMNNYPAAIVDADEAIKLNPHYALAYLARGIALRLQGEYNLALKDYDKSIAINPGVAEAYYRRGMVWIARGEYARGRKDLGEALSLKPNFEQALAAWESIADNQIDDSDSIS
ncbi:MAG: tetratricopeptide (TPR) repeat protein [Candidatus Omnitrophota bacterium]|jgi:tetratricopeptide (TPR) repeat protein